MEDVCRFPDLPARRQLTYQAKQLIAREIELEKMRRAEALLQARNLGEVGRARSLLWLQGGGGPIDRDKVLWGCGLSKAAGGFHSAKGNPGLTPPSHSRLPAHLPLEQRIPAGVRCPKCSPFCRNCRKKWLTVG